MSKMTKLFGILLLGVMVFSSCSKQKYTASFAPSKSKVWNKEAVAEAKAELPVEKISKEVVIEKEEAVVTTEEKAAPVVEKNIVKATQIDDEVAREEALKPTFTKTEIKSMKKEVKKSMFKAVKNSILNKRPQNQNKLLYVILALFPILCLISIYLYQGQQISLDFWLDLILHFTVIGEIIYALLVVLDIVSVA